MLNSWALLGVLESTQYTRRAVAAGVLMLMRDNSTQWGGRELEAWELGREIANLPALFLSHSKRSLYLPLSSNFRKPQETKRCLPCFTG